MNASSPKRFPPEHPSHVRDMSDDIERDQFFYLLFILIILAIERLFPFLHALRGKSRPDAVKKTHTWSYLSPVINTCQG